MQDLEGLKTELMAKEEAKINRKLERVAIEREIADCKAARKELLGRIAELREQLEVYKVRRVKKDADQE